MLIVMFLPCNPRLFDGRLVATFVSLIFNRKTYIIIKHSIYYNSVFDCGQNKGIEKNEKENIRIFYNDAVNCNCSSSSRNYREW